jgi:6-phosphogluconolactonase/glucosamine-6-phosphate isomerase/deaminase
MIDDLVRRHRAVDWSRVGVWQVDERVAPDGHPDRNANQLTALPARLHLMPVTAADLEAAAAEYAAGLPERFDVVHLGMGPDGHTASWPPGDPIVDLPPERRVGLSQPYQGRVRMSLLPEPVNAASGRVALITGADKAPAVAAWIEGSRFEGDLPIRRVRRGATTVVLDRAAASMLETW